MKSISMLSFVVIAIAASTVVCAEDSLPHIVVILADDLGYGDVGAFHSGSKIATPHLDRLAEQGMRFTDAHAGGSVCVPSRYALLTGRFAARATLQVRNGPVIEEGRMTIATLLRERGYRTAMVGKWHQGFETSPIGSKLQYDYDQPLRGGPLDRGFDSFFGMHASLDIPPYFFINGRTVNSPPTEMIQASTSVGGEDEWTKIQGAFWREGLRAPDFNHDEVTPRFVAEAMGVLRSHADGQGEKPLFLYVALPSPHTPWLPTDAFRGKSGAGMYGDFVMQVDAAVGQIVASLESSGLSENTLVLFSSDNGPVWYEKDIERFGHDSVGGLRGKKGNPWEGGHRVPFIVRWPGRVAAGSVSDRTVVFSDVLATFADITDRSSGVDVEDGISFLPFLVGTNQPSEPRPPIVHDQKTLRDGDWKLILSRNGNSRKKNRSGEIEGELYNLRDDVSEEKNLIRQEQRRAQRMRDRLESILAS